MKRRPSQMPKAQLRKGKPVRAKQSRARKEAVSSYVGDPFEDGDSLEVTFRNGRWQGKLRRKRKLLAELSNHCLFTIFIVASDRVRSLR